MQAVFKTENAKTHFVTLKNKVIANISLLGRKLSDLGSENNTLNLIHMKICLCRKIS
jgi:hypothetical protein